MNRMIMRRIILISTMS